MGLDPDLLELLSAKAILSRLAPEEDTYGNNVYRGGGTIRCFITDETAGSSGPDQQDQKPNTPTSTRYSLLVDALDIKVGDRLVIGQQNTYVTSVKTYRDELGKLYQEVETTSEREV